MHIEHHRWYSSRLEREMELKAYGHWGRPIIVFPCSRGRYYEYEGMRMIAAIAHHIDSGRVKLFCVDSIDAESWYNFDIPPADRCARHDAYDGYIVDEVVRFIRDHCRQPHVRVIANGCSIGAYHSVNFFLKHPDLFECTIGLSGLYRLDRYEYGLDPSDVPAVYFNSPLSYLPDLQNEWYLDWYRRSAIAVCEGQGAWEEEALEDTRRLEELFRQKDIPAQVEF